MLPAPGKPPAPVACLQVHGSVQELHGPGPCPCCWLLLLVLLPLLLRWRAMERDPNSLGRIQKANIGGRGGKTTGPAVTVSAVTVPVVTLPLAAGGVG